MGTENSGAIGTRLGSSLIPRSDLFVTHVCLWDPFGCYLCMINKYGSNWSQLEDPGILDKACQVKDWL